MLPLLLTLKNKEPTAVPVGQTQFISPGTYTWTVPEDVYSVSVVLIAPGQRPRSYATNGANSDGRVAGAGGGLRYQNDLPVVPGTRYNIVVGSPGVSVPPQYGDTPELNNISSAFGITVGTGTTGTAIGGNIGGGSGSIGRTAYNELTAGSAGTYYGTGILSVKNKCPGQGSGILGSNTPAAQQIYGGGGYGRYSHASMKSDASPGTGGAVRIIWGPNRAFPNTNVQNM